MTKPEATCFAEGCDRSADWKNEGRRGLCSLHYQRLRNEVPFDDPLRIVGDDEARFYAKTTRADNGCLIWTAATYTRTGYAEFGWGNAMIQGHVWAWIHHHGPIPDGLVVGHHCHDLDLACRGGRSCPHRPCVEIDHLVLQTNKENILAGRSPMADNARKTCCPKCGGEYVFDSRGYRVCPPCRAAHKKAKRQERSNQGLPRDGKL